jgi:hypothetical protein
MSNLADFLKQLSGENSEAVNFAGNAIAASLAVAGGLPINCPLSLRDALNAALAAATITGVKTVIVTG